VPPAVRDEGGILEASSKVGTYETHRHCHSANVRRQQRRPCSRSHDKKFWHGHHAPDATGHFDISSGYARTLRDSLIGNLVSPGVDTTFHGRKAPNFYTTSSTLAGVLSAVILDSGSRIAFCASEPKHKEY
jgi:hypothetical protein